MRTPKLFNIFLLFILILLISYPAGRAMISIDYYNNKLPTDSKCNINPHRTLQLAEVPIYIICVVLISFRHFQHAIVTFIVDLFRILTSWGATDYDRVEELVNPPSHPWPGQQKRDSVDPNGYHRDIPLHPHLSECEYKFKGKDTQDCIARVIRRDRMYIIVAGIASVVTCLLFVILIIRYIRMKKQDSNLLRKEEAMKAVNRVGLGRGLGSDHVGVGGRDGMREVDQDSVRDLELGCGRERGDELIDSSWKSPITRRSSTGWKRLLRGGQSSASMELKENTYLSPPPSQIPPRIPTPKLPGSGTRLSFFNDSLKSRSPLSERKPVRTLAFDDEQAFPTRPGLVIPEIRVISTGSTY